MSNQPASSPSPSQPVKKRSPLERTIVWGGILVLLVLLAVQARARFGYSMTLKKLQSVWEKDDVNADALLVSEVNNHVYGWPQRSIMRVSDSKQSEWPWNAAGQSLSSKCEAIVYRWRGVPGLSKAYGMALLYEPAGPGSSESPAITSLLTDSPEPVPEQQVASTTEPGDIGGTMPGGPDGMPGGGAPSGFGGGGGGGGFDPMQLDTDGDGMISKDEANERMKEDFDTDDANADGFLDADELAAWRERRRAAGGGQGGGRGGERPPAEEAPAGDKPESAPSTDAKPDAPPSDAAKGAETEQPKDEAKPDA